MGQRALERAHETVERQARALDDLHPAYTKLSEGSPLGKADRRKIIEHLRFSPEEIDELHSGPEFSQEHMEFLFKRPAAHFYAHDESRKLWRVDVVWGEEVRAIPEDDPDFE